MEIRVLHISTPLSWRGGEQQLAYTFHELQQAGIWQMLLCPEGSTMADYCANHQLNYATAPKRNSMDTAFASKLAELVKREKIGIVHAHDSHAHTFCVMASLLYRMKAPIVLHRRVDYPVSKSFLSRYKYNHPQIKKIICVSHEVKKVLSQSLKNPDKAIVIHSGIDTRKFAFPPHNLLREELGIDASKNIIGNVAAITQQKDYFTFVKAAKLIHQEVTDTHFVVIGDGDQKEEIQNLVKESGLEKAFSFLGFRSEIHQLLPCLDILMFSSEKEGLGTTIIDAFAAKVSVVATRAGGIPELVEHGVTGLLADVKNEQMLAENVIDLIQHPERKKDIEEKAYLKAQQFDKSRTASRILEVYRNILEG